MDLLLLLLWLRLVELFDLKDGFCNVTAVECDADAGWQVLVEHHLIVGNIVIETATEGQVQVLHRLTLLTCLL